MSKEIRSDVQKVLKNSGFNIEGYNYTLKYEDGKTITRNIEFYFENKLQINDYIYILEDVGYVP